MTHENIDDILRSTAAETRFALDDGGALPPFEPNNNRGPAIAVAVVLVALVLSGGWLLGSAFDDDAEVQTVEEPELDSVDPPGLDDEAPEPETTTTTVPRVVDLEVREQVEVDRPDFAESYVDPAFGTTITRVTDTMDGERIIPVQAPAAMWNADESLMLLYRTGGDVSGHVIVDAATFEIVGELGVIPSDIEHVFWHPTDPGRIMTTTQERELVTVSVLTGEVETVASFPECDSVDPGIGTAGPSWDGSVIALRCLVGDAVTVMSQRLDGSPAALLRVDDGEQAMVSADGRTIVVETATGFELYDAELTELISTIDWFASSPTMGIDGDGNATIVSSGYEADFPGLVVTAQIDGGSRGTPVVGANTVQVIVGPDTGYSFPVPGARVSATGWDVPGLFVAASPIPESVLNGEPIETFDGEVTLVDVTTTPPTIQRLAHTRNTAAGPFSSTFVSISPSGRFIAFASDFGGDTTDTYVIDLER